MLFDEVCKRNLDKLCIENLIITIQQFWLHGSTLHLYFCVRQSSGPCTLYSVSRSKIKAILAAFAVPSFLFYRRSGKRLSARRPNLLQLLDLNMNWWPDGKIFIAIRRKWHPVLPISGLLRIPFQRLFLSCFVPCY